MDNIVPFEKKPLRYWKCPCGCFTFFVQSTGVLECANCSSFIETGEWKKPPEFTGDTHDEPEDDGTGKKIVEMDTSSAALKKIMNEVDEETTAFVVVASWNGWIRAWGVERLNKKWTREMWKVAKDILLGKTKQ